MNDLDQAPFGASTLETSLAIVATRLVHTGAMSWMTAIERMSTAPAAIAGIEAGSLAVGAPADVAIIAPDETWVVDPQRFYSSCQSSPHEGDEVRGRVIYTIVAGEVRYTRRPALDHLAVGTARG